MHLFELSSIHDIWLAAVDISPSRAVGSSRPRIPGLYSTTPIFCCTSDKSNTVHHSPENSCEKETSNSWHAPRRSCDIVHFGVYIHIADIYVREGVLFLRLGFDYAVTSRKYDLLLRSWLLYISSQMSRFPTVSHERPHFRGMGGFFQSMSGGMSSQYMSDQGAWFCSTAATCGQ